MPVLAKIAPRDGLAAILDAKGSIECLYDANGITVPYPSASATGLHDFESAIVSVRDAQEAVSVLNQKADMSMCLDMVLMLFDDDISHQTKTKLAIELQPLLSETAVKQYTQDILFARPLPAAANLDAAAAAAAGIEPTSSFIQEVVDLQPRVHRIFDAWLMVEKNTLVDQTGEGRVFAFLSLNGVFRRLTLEVTNQAELRSIKGELILAADSNRRQRIDPIDVQAFLHQFKKLLPLETDIQVALPQPTIESPLLANTAKRSKFLRQMVPHLMGTINMVAHSSGEAFIRVVLPRSFDGQFRTGGGEDGYSFPSETRENRWPAVIEPIENRVLLSSDNCILSDDIISVNWSGASDRNSGALLGSWVVGVYSDLSADDIFESNAILTTGVNIDLGTMSRNLIRVKDVDPSMLLDSNTFTVLSWSVNEVQQIVELLSVVVTDIHPRGAVLGVFSSIEPGAVDALGYSMTVGIDCPCTRSFTIAASGYAETPTILLSEQNAFEAVTLLYFDVHELVIEAAMTVHATNTLLLPEISALDFDLSVAHKRAFGLDSAIHLVCHSTGTFIDTSSAAQPRNPPALFDNFANTAGASSKPPLYMTGELAETDTRMTLPCHTHFSATGTYGGTAYLSDSDIQTDSVGIDWTITNLDPAVNRNIVASAGCIAAYCRETITVNLSTSEPVPGSDRNRDLNFNRENEVTAFNSLAPRQIMTCAVLVAGIGLVADATSHTKDKFTLSTVGKDSIAVLPSPIRDPEQATSVAGEQPYARGVSRIAESASELKLLTVYLQIEKRAITYLISDLENRLFECEGIHNSSNTKALFRRLAIDQAVRCFQRNTESLPIADESQSIRLIAQELILKFYRSLAGTFPYIDTASIEGIRETERDREMRLKAAANHMRWLISELTPLIHKIDKVLDENRYALMMCESDGGDVDESIRLAFHIV